MFKVILAETTLSLKEISIDLLFLQEHYVKREFLLSQMMHHASNLH